MTHTLIEILGWLGALIFVGLIGFPFCFSFLRFLPGRGIAFARIVGVLLLSFVYWLGGMLGFTDVMASGGLISCIVVAVLALILWKQNFTEIRTWFATNRRYAYGIEAVFLIGFLLVLLFRFADPNIAGTEKPMELMFINSILRSSSFPPHDSWLSGYGISYYYLGYVISAFLIRISGVSSVVGFNLMLATIFGLSAAAAYAIANDLLSLFPAKIGRVRSHFGALLAPILILFCGNWEGFLEQLYAFGLFWKSDQTSAFWQWLNLKELNVFPPMQLAGDITNRPGIWWWRASRVISDTALNGGAKEVIDEFPFFSFYLGDLHPHVIGIPFVLLAIGLALNAYLWFLAQDEKESGSYWFEQMRIGLQIFSSPLSWFSAFCIGGLIFINTWDFPFYFALFVGAIGLARFQKEKSWLALLLDIVRIAVPFGLQCLSFYLLFLLGLSSQAGGIIPSGVYATRTISFFVMFGQFLIPLFWGLFSIGRQRVDRESSRPVLRFGLFLFIALVAIQMLIFGGMILFSAFPLGQSNLMDSLQRVGKLYLDSQGAVNVENVFFQFVLHRLFTLPTTLILLAGILISLMVFRSDKVISTCKSEGFVSLLMFLGFTIILVPEFFYLRDFFGSRMNTIFKFYYQAWILLGLASSAAICFFFARSKGIVRALFTICMALVIGMGLIYPLWASSEKFNLVINQAHAKKWDQLTLDGSTFLQRSRADDWAGIVWLQQAEFGVIAEKVGGSYTSENAFSTFTGLPAVLGPTNHESQWRGGYREIGSREDDIKQLYETRNKEVMTDILTRYKIRYVVVSSTEKNAYQVKEQKFEQYLTLIFDEGQCRIYQVY